MSVVGTDLSDHQILSALQEFRKALNDPDPIRLNEAGFELGRLTGDSCFSEAYEVYVLQMLEIRGSQTSRH